MALLLVAGAACGSGSDDVGAPPRTVTRQEVTDLSPGDLTDLPFTAVYVSVRERLVACHCRVGSCAQVHPAVGEHLTVDLQRGGVLTIIGGGNLQLKGGVNRDGSFWCGGFSDEIGGSGNLLLNGTFMPAGVQPATIAVIAARTAMSITGRNDYDCDTTITGTFTPLSP